MRIMALDIGDKRIGMAISDLMGWTAQPLYTIHRKNLEKDMEEIVENVTEYLPATLVVGLPKNMDGSSGFQADKTIEFVERLKEKLPDNIEVVYQDERLSTKSASQVMAQTGIKKKNKKNLVDTIAAVFILETYLMKKK
ncbi:MAG: Holliday junction resolvase RuvX [Filifactor alocis]|nr:Holliday junction resolvase RuvX [Filifactor alocis]